MHNDKQLAQLAEPHHRGEAREIAAIDLGSNSFHMIVARIINGSIQVLSRLKQKAVRNAQLFFDLKVVVIEKLPQEGRN